MLPAALSLYIGGVEDLKCDNGYQATREGVPSVRSLSSGITKRFTNVHVWVTHTNIVSQLTICTGQTDLKRRVERFERT